MELSEDGAACAFESVVNDDGSATVRLQGEVDLANVAALRREVEDLLQNDPSRLVFDLAELSFVDSSGLALLVEAAERAHEVEVRNPSALVRRIIEGTGLAQVLPMTP
jgi:anti-sigma B factor antagonist